MCVHTCTVGEVDLLLRPGDSNVICLLTWVNEKSWRKNEYNLVLTATDIKVSFVQRVRFKCMLLPRGYKQSPDSRIHLLLKLFDGTVISSVLSYFSEV